MTRQSKTLKWLLLSLTFFFLVVWQGTLQAADKDIHVVEKPPENANGAHKKDKEEVENMGETPIMVTSVEEMVSEVLEELGDGNCIKKLYLYGHGSSGNISVGDGTKHIPGKRINGGENEWWKHLQKLKGRLCEGAKIYLFGCNVGSCSKGAAKLKKLADLLGVTVKGAVDIVNAGKNKDYIENGRWQTATADESQPACIKAKEEKAKKKKKDEVVVTLVAFQAQKGEYGVDFIWETASEFNSAGFNIYRSEVEDGEYVRINEELIPAKGSEGGGAGYSYTDTEVVTGMTYYYKLESVDLTGSSTWHGPISITLGMTGVAEGPSPFIPDVFALAQNYPNPFNATTTISYALPVTGERELVTSPTHTTVRIYNILGQEVVTLVDGTKEAGYHSVQWNGTDSAGQVVPSGIYIYRITAGNWTDAKRMVLLK